MRATLTCGRSRRCHAPKRPEGPNIAPARCFGGACRRPVGLQRGGSEAAAAVRTTRERNHPRAKSRDPGGVAGVRELDEVVAERRDDRREEGQARPDLPRRHREAAMSPATGHPAPSHRRAQLTAPQAQLTAAAQPVHAFTFSGLNESRIIEISSAWAGADRGRPVRVGCGARLARRLGLRSGRL